MKSSCFIAAHDLVAVRHLLGEVVDHEPGGPDREGLALLDGVAEVHRLEHGVQLGALRRPEVDQVERRVVVRPPAKVVTPPPWTPMLPVIACRVSSACMCRSPWYQCESPKPTRTASGLARSPQLWPSATTWAAGTSVSFEVYSGRVLRRHVGERLQGGPRLQLARGVRPEDGRRLERRVARGLELVVGLVEDDVVVLGAGDDVLGAQPLAVRRVDQVRADRVAADVVGVVEAVLEDVVDDAVDEGRVGPGTDRHASRRSGRR